MSAWHESPALPAPPKVAAAPGAAQAALDRRVRELVHDGWRVDSTVGDTVVMVKGHRVNHLLHLLITIFLLGLWLFVWIPLAIFGGEKRMTVYLDQNGRLRESGG